MKLKILSQSIFALITVTFPVIASAEDCSKALIPDKSTIHNDIKTKVAFLKVINKENYDEIKKNAGLTIDDLGANYDEFSTKRNTYYEEVGFSESNYDASNYLIQHTPPAAFEAYTRCLELKAGEDYGVHLIPVKISDSNVSFTIIWHPAPTPENLKSEVKADLKGFESGQENIIPTTILPNARIPVTLKRLKDQEQSIDITIASIGKNLTIPLPPKVNTPVPPCKNAEIDVPRTRVTEGDDRITRVAYCPDGYDYVDEHTLCQSTAPDQSGPVVEKKQIGSGVYCRWQKPSLKGVGLDVYLHCKLKDMSKACP